MEEFTLVINTDTFGGDGVDGGKEKRRGKKEFGIKK